MHALHGDYKKAMILASDIEVHVLLLAIATASILPGCELWLAFGHGSNFRYISAHGIADKLGTYIGHGRSPAFYSCMLFFWMCYHIIV